MKRSLATAFACLGLTLLTACSSSLADDDRGLTRVHVGSDPLVLDAREIFTATGEFTVTVEAAAGGSATVDGELVTFTPDSELGYGQLTLIGEAPNGDSVEAVVDVFYAPRSFSFHGVINNADPAHYAEYMTAYSGAVRGDRFGEKFFDAGDWNGDGFEDMLVVASRANLPYIDQGAVYLLEGGPNGLIGPYIVAEGQEGRELFGSRAKAGDLDGDGLTDLIFADRTMEGDFYRILWGGNADDVAQETVELPFQTVQFVADLDGDGVAEIGAYGGETQDSWTVYRGGSRDTVASEVAFEMPACNGYGDVTVLGDVADDEGLELVARCDNVTEVRSGVTGEAIRTFTGPHFPTQAVGDLDGNGVAELVVETNTSSDSYIEFGGLDAVDEQGCTDSRIPLPSNAYVMSDMKDVDHDGVGDLVYSIGGDEDNTGWEAGLWLSSVDSCDPLAEPASYPQFWSGIRSALSRDIDGDGERELLLGALGGAGHVVVFDLP